MTALRAFFAEAAAREVASREKHYPDMIAAGEIARDDAGADIAAWRAIAALFAAPSVETDLSWAQLELATSRALQRREDELEAQRAIVAGQDAEAATEEDIKAQRKLAPLRERRDAVWAIHERITRARWFWTLDRSPPPEPVARAA